MQPLPSDDLALLYTDWATDNLALPQQQLSNQRAEEQRWQDVCGVGLELARGRPAWPDFLVLLQM
jgi:hypothetical protein